MDYSHIQKKLHKLKTDKKNKNKKNIASSVTDIVKFTSRNHSSWASIVKKSLNMNVPKLELVMLVSENESTNSSPEVSFFKKFKKEEDEGMVIPKQPTYPPEIINIPDDDDDDDDDLSSIESCFMNETPKVTGSKNI